MCLLILETRISPIKFDYQYAYSPTSKSNVYLEHIQVSRIHCTKEKDFH